MYYIRMYGLSDHLERVQAGLSEEKYFSNLLGRINYVLSLEPENEKMKKYRELLLSKPVLQVIEVENMRDEYNFNELNARKNPYAKKLKNKNIINNNAERSKTIETR